MNSGDRIKAARNMRGMTLKELGVEMHYPYKSADVRIAQYESGRRGIKDDVIHQLADALRVSPEALRGPIGYERNDVMRILFDLEDHGYQIDVHKKGEHIVVEILADALAEPLEEWKKIKTRMKLDRMSEKAYVEWKFCWPDNTSALNSEDQVRK